jgi:hypothetical protein
MKAIHVLARIDGPDDGLLVQVFGERHLDENAMNGRVVVQFGDVGQQGLHGGVVGKLQLEGVEAEFAAFPVLGTDISFGGGIVSD